MARWYFLIDCKPEHGISKLKINLATKLNMYTSLHFKTRGLEKAWACDNEISLDSWQNFKRYRHITKQDHIDIVHVKKCWPLYRQLGKLKSIEMNKSHVHNSFISIHQFLYKCIPMFIVITFSEVAFFTKISEVTIFTIKKLQLWYKSRLYDAKFNECPKDIC